MLRGTFKCMTSISLAKVDRLKSISKQNRSAIEHLPPRPDAVSDCPRVAAGDCLAITRLKLWEDAEAVALPFTALEEKHAQSVAAGVDAAVNVWNWLRTLKWAPCDQPRAGDWGVSLIELYANFV